MRAAARSPEGEFIRRCLKGSIESDEENLGQAARSVADWDRVVALAAAHRVSPWLVRKLSAFDRSPAPERTLDALRRDARERALRSLSLCAAMEEALLALEARGVPVVVMKGPVVAELLYPDPALRPYDDIDIIVPLEARAAVHLVCGALGYSVVEDHGGERAAQPGTCEHALETVYARTEPPARLDVHFDHLQIGMKPRNLAGLWRRARPWRFQRATALAPELHDVFLALAVHLHRHCFSRLIWLKDLDLLVRQFGNELDWRRLEATARQEGAALSLKLSLRTVTRVLETPLPVEARLLARSSPATLVGSLLWRDSILFGDGSAPLRWRRAVQFAPWEGPRGALPSLLLMGRRTDKLRALWRRSKHLARRSKT